MDYPKTDLIRMVNVAAADLRSAGADGRTMVGYPIVFNKPTRIRSWEGDFVERVAPGATKKTLRENTPKVLFNHGYDPQIGDKPLGVPVVMREDRNGLYTEVRLSDTSYNDDLIALMRDGAIDGMSFRFSVVKETWNQKPGRSSDNPDGLPERMIQEMKIAEFGPVTFPAYQATEVGVRSRNELSAWQQLPEQKRNELRRLLGMEDRSTPISTAGMTTVDGGAATDTPAEPTVTVTHALTIDQRQRLAASRIGVRIEPQEVA